VSMPAAFVGWLVTQIVIVGIAIYLTDRNGRARRELRLERVEFEKQLNASRERFAARTTELDTMAKRAELAELELGTRKIRLTGAPVWEPTRTPGVRVACDGGVIVGLVVHELRELAFGEASDPADPFGSAAVDDGWRAYCRLEGSGAGSVQWSAELYSLKRAQAEVQRMVGELAIAAMARARRAAQ